MKRRHAISSVLFLMGLLISVESYGQGQKGNFGGVQLRTTGYGIKYAHFGEATGSFRKTFSMDGFIHKHPKEHRIYNPEIQNSGTYVYGKLNRVGLLRINAGFQKSLIPRDAWNNIGLAINTSLGPQIAGLKPVYLNIYHPGPNGEPGTVTPERYDPDIQTSQSNIVGYAEPRHGWDELTFTYGFQFTSSIQMSWGNIGTGVKVLQLGASLDYYPSGLIIMANTPNPKLYGSLFVSFLWGKDGDL